MEQQTILAASRLASLTLTPVNTERPRKVVFR